MSVETYPPGWTPEISKRGQENFQASGKEYFSGVPFRDDDRPLPQGFSLSVLLKWLYDQGQVGSCFANMMAHIHQLMQASLQFKGFDGTVFNPSRRIIWYQCRKLDGSLGSRQAGGSITNSFAAVGQGPGGVGVCKEELWPYRPDHNWLEQRPTQEAFADAEKNQILEIARVNDDYDSWKRAIYNGKPPGIGIWWPTGWSTRTDGGAPTRSALDKYSRTVAIGGGGYGHAIVPVGWLNDWDGHNYIEILNSHGQKYAPPPPDVIARIPGYAHHGYSFWAREDMLREVWNYGWAEACIGAGVEGFTENPLADYMLI